MLKISIVTPSFDRPDYLEETIRSVVEQIGEFEVEYIVQDGGSDDDTIRILRKWQNQIANKTIPLGCAKLTFLWRSEPDQGMYEAIKKGFESSTGDVMAWINTDDFYLPGALAAVSQIFSQHPEINWISGLKMQANAFGSVVKANCNMGPYSRLLISGGTINRDIGVMA